MNELLDTVEAAAFFKISTSTFARMRERDGFPQPILINMSKVWRLDDLREWAGLTSATRQNRSVEEIKEIVAGIMHQLSRMANALEKRP
jgi:predicted DNA-binding transcriptional regulator AlpA